MYLPLLRRVAAVGQQVLAGNEPASGERSPIAAIASALPSARNAVGVSVKTGSTTLTRMPRRA
jgi:hypothetical protein